jgi:ketosteroid isomerase-like protein
MRDTKSEIAAVCRTAADALRQGADAEEFGSLLYTPELVVVGEAWPRAIRGLAAFKADLAALLDAWGPGANLTFSIVDPVIGGDQSATTLVDVLVVPGKADIPREYYRAIYCWVRTERGWRVALEMYQVGSF